MVHLHGIHLMACLLLSLPDLELRSEQYSQCAHHAADRVQLHIAHCRSSHSSQHDQQSQLHLGPEVLLVEVGLDDHHSGYAQQLGDLVEADTAHIREVEQAGAVVSGR